jgi:type VI secretion system protein ImpJ
MSAADSTQLLPEAVSWTEGMLLSPQHFQQNDIYWHATLRQRLAAVQPNFWGIQELALDMTELVKGRVVVERLRAVMGDGLVIDYPGHYAPQPLMLDLSKHDWTGAPNVSVHLRIPVRGRGAASNIGDMQRYTTEPGALEADESNVQDEINVDRLRPRIGLYAGDSVPKSYCSFPLLRLRGDTRGVHLTDFHPPMLDLAASAFQGDVSLRNLLDNLSARLWAKYRELLGVRIGEQPRYGEDSVAQVYAARCLAMALPAFDVALKSGVAHPYELYVALAQLVGFVAATPSAPQPPALPGYVHNDCMPAFQQAIRYITTQIDQLNADYRVLEFEPVGRSGFRCRLPAGTRTDSLFIELRPRSGQTGPALGNWLRNARIAAHEMLQTLLRRRFPGAGVREADAARIAALNLRPGSFVFEIRNANIELDEGKTRRLIVDDDELVILGEPGDEVPASILLYLPRTREAMPTAPPSGDG